MITVRRFWKLDHALRVLDFGPLLDWTESIDPPASGDDFAEQAIYVICNSGMRYIVAGPIFERCMVALRSGASATTVYGHPGKSRAIDDIWRDRDDIFVGYQSADDKLAYCQALPWIGPVTKYHLVKNLGVDTAKPDVHLVRLAKRDKTTPLKLCQHLSKHTGRRIATVDTTLWLACAEGILNSRRYEKKGWRAAFAGSAA